jgi:hypothetical protein
MRIHAHPCASMRIHAPPCAALRRHALTKKMVDPKTPNNVK